MEMIQRIKAIETLDNEDAIKLSMDISKELTGRDIVVCLSESFEEPEESDYYGPIEYYLDFSKLDTLESSWMYISSIIQSILSGIAQGNTTVYYGASHKYSFMDTLTCEEISAVAPDSTDDRTVIHAIGSLWH